MLQASFLICELLHGCPLEAADSNVPFQAAQAPELQQRLDQTRAELHASAEQAKAAAADASAAVRRGREAEARLRAVCEECRQLQGQGQRQAAAMAQLQAELQEEKGRHAEARQRFAEQVCGRRCGGHEKWDCCRAGLKVVQTCQLAFTTATQTVDGWKPGNSFAEQVWLAAGLASDHVVLLTNWNTQLGDAFMKNVLHARCTCHWPDRYSHKARPSKASAQPEGFTACR